MSRRTPLIRDWGDVFLELGDKQSLLASLKESQFFKAFEDQGITYEVHIYEKNFGELDIRVRDGWYDSSGLTTPTATHLASSILRVFARHVLKRERQQSCG